MSNVRIFKNLTKAKANGNTTVGDTTLVTNPGRWHLQKVVPNNSLIGQTTSTTDGAGEIAITHGAEFTPDWAMVGIVGDNQYIARVKTITSTTLTVVIKNDAGADVTSTSVTVNWEVREI